MHRAKVESEIIRDLVLVPIAVARPRSSPPLPIDPSDEAKHLHDVRCVELSNRVVDLIRRFAPHATRALDIGAQQALITSRLSQNTGIRFDGIDPAMRTPYEDFGSIRVVRAAADDIPFPSESFDLVTFISVYEHIEPRARRRSLSEMFRVLRPTGVLIGQFPNMFYPIESHSRLPLQSYLPASVGAKYYQRFAKVPWKHVGVNWFRVGPRSLKADAAAAGFAEIQMFRSNYSIEAVPSALRRFYKLAEAFPMNFDFVFKKSHEVSGRTAQA